MAKIGLTNFRYAILTENSNGTYSYGGAKTPAKAISCSVSISNNDAKLYADDAVAETDTTFQSGTATIGIDKEDTTTMADLLGHTVSDGELIRNATDIAPYVGFGRVITKIENGAYKYTVEILNKVKFAEPSQDNQTKGESVEFSTSEMEGIVATLADGRWSSSKTFDSKADAISYLEGVLGGNVAGTTYTVTFNANSGTGSYDAVTAHDGEVISVPDGSALTPPSNKHFIGWDTTSTATKADITGAYTVTANTTLYAIYVAN